MNLKDYGLEVGKPADLAVLDAESPEQAVAERADLPGVDPRLVRAVGLQNDQHFILLDVDALFAPIIGS